MSNPIDDFFEAVERTTESKTPDRLVTLAKVDPAYAGGTTAKVIFDGESTLSTRAYPTTIVPTANGRVVMLRAGSTWVIIGQIR